MKSSPVAQRRADPLAVCLIFAVAGILIDNAATIPCTAWNLLLALCLAAFFALCFASKRDPKIEHFRNRSLKTLSILLGVTFFFASLHHYQWNRFDTHDIGFYAKPEPQAVCLRGTVLEPAFLVPAPPLDPGQSIPTPPKVGFVLQVKEVRDGETWIHVTGRCVTYVDHAETLPRLGDTLRLYGDLATPSPPKNPGTYDAASRLRARRILAILRVQYENSCVPEENGGVSIFRTLETIRRGAQANLKRYTSESASPLATAMLLGFREDVELATEQTLLETGTMHILAISGMHIGLIAGAAYLAFRVLRFSNSLTAIGLIVFVCFYFCLTDQRAPALRATLLVCIASTAMLFHRKPLSVNTICATALVVLLCNPRELFQFGAQLSFLASSVFLWLPSSRRFFSSILVTQTPGEEKSGTPSVSRLLREKAFQYSTRITDVFLFSFAVMFVSLPLILEQIHLVTPVALLVNPTLWLPLTLALVSGLATMVLAWICPPLAGVTGMLASWSFEMLERWISYFHGLPGGHFWSPGPASWWLLGFYTVLVFLTLFPFLRPRRRIVVTAFALWCLFGLVGSWVKSAERYFSDRLEIHVLSVGHGASTLLVTPEGKTLVYDAGCFSRPMISAEALSQKLWRAGKRRIDKLVISHPDSDHFNAVPLLSERFAIGEVCVSPYMFDKRADSVQYLKEVLEKRNIPVRVITSGEEIPLGKSVRIRVLHPNAKERAHESDPEILSNSASVVLLAEHRGKRILLPGDLETKRKSVPVTFLQEPATPCEAIMVPHHGGNSNLTDPLLQWSRPKSLLISGGRFTYRAESLEDFRNRGYELFHTLEDGCTSITIDKSGVRYRTFRTKREVIE